MRVINIILATAGWIWLGLVALFFYRRMRRERAETAENPAMAKHDQ